MKSSLALLALAAVSSCGSKCPEPSYFGAASDEAWRTMQDGEGRAKADDAKAVQLTFPTPGAAISGAGAPPTFLWTTPLTASRDRIVPRGLLSQRAPSWPERVSGWLYSSAWAHLPPVTGPIHWLRITVPGRACPLETVTTLNEWTPNDAAWKDLKAQTKGTLSFDVLSAYLQQNRISEGPYHFTRPLTFTVTP